MIDPLDPEEAALTARLEAMFLETDPVPAELVVLAQQSYALRDLDGELAALVEDSHDDTPAPVAVRGPAAPAAPRHLTFQVVDERGNDELILAVRVETVGPSRRLTGQLDPQGPATIELRQPAAPARTHPADAYGLFVIDDVLPGPMSLTVHRPGVPGVSTQWTLV